MHGNDVAVGTVEGTGAALNVSIGFQPRAVLLRNIDGLAKLDWTETMGAGKGMKTITAGTISFIATNGITKYAGSVGGNGEGFTIGADADINVSAETIEYIAFR